MAYYTASQFQLPATKYNTTELLAATANAFAAELVTLLGNAWSVTQEQTGDVTGSSTNYTIVFNNSKGYGICFYFSSVSGSSSTVGLYIGAIAKYNETLNSPEFGYRLTFMSSSLTGVEYFTATKFNRYDEDEFLIKIQPNAANHRDACFTIYSGKANVFLTGETINVLQVRSIYVSPAFSSTLLNAVYSDFYEANGTVQLLMPMPLKLSGNSGLVAQRQDVFAGRNFLYHGIYSVNNAIYYTLSGDSVDAIRIKDV